MYFFETTVAVLISVMLTFIQKKMPLNKYLKYTVMILHICIFDIIYYIERWDD